MTSSTTESQSVSTQANNYNLGGSPPVRVDPAEMDNKAKDKAGRKALNALTGPIRIELGIGRVMAFISAILAIAPYVALVEIGSILFTAQQTGGPIDGDALWGNVWLLLGSFLLRIVIYVFALSLTHFADVKFRSYLRTLMLDRLGRAPLAWFTAINSGRVRKAIQDDAAQIHTLIAHAPVEMTSAIVQPIALLVYAFYIDWRLGIVAILNIPVFVAAYAYMMRDMGEKTAEMDTRLAKVSATMVEFVSGISVVKAFGHVGRAHAQYQTAADEFGAFYLAWCEPMLKGNAIAITFISIPAMLLVNLGCGALLVNAGYVNPVQVLATTLIALLLPMAVMTVGMSTWAYQMAGGAALRIQETLDTPILEPPSVPQTPSSYDVAFHDVSFAYGDTVALEHIDLELKAGTVTALIGPSGSGKSTLATLVARFADPDAGSVTIGGVDIRDIDPDHLYRYVAFVLQDPQLIQATIYDNIVMGRPHATKEEVESAARAAYIHDEIAAFPKGYETVIGQDANVSGGQAQRIAIARALLIDAPILILDEATAATDPDSEAEIQQALNALVKDRTVLVIAHRLSAITGADQIVVLERGRIVAQGAHERILDNPHYQTLLAMNGMA
ncbi:ABC transporter ATP-binding protein [Stomatohabitans albus]|uniref:ABC transporter ATP-binding protein n=1 Tax=Stomatohabitans albus TaxID=3110766 RepID=UPI00300C884D